MALLFPFYKWAHWRAGLSHMWPLCSGASHSCVGPAFDFQTSQYVNGSYSQGRFLLGKFVVATGSSRKPTPRDLSFRFYSRFSESIGFENNLGFPQPGSGRRAFTEHWQHLQTEPRRRVSLGSTPRQLLRWKNFAFNWQPTSDLLSISSVMFRGFSTQNTALRMGATMLIVSFQGPTHAVWWLQLAYIDLAASASSLWGFPHSKEQNVRSPVMSLDLTWFNSASQAEPSSFPQMDMPIGTDLLSKSLQQLLWVSSFWANMTLVASSEKILSQWTVLWKAEEKYHLSVSTRLWILLYLNLA